MSDYVSAQAVIVTARLQGLRPKWELTAAISLASACVECGAPIGFYCHNAEKTGNSCVSRFDAWTGKAKQANGS